MKTIKGQFRQGDVLVEFVDGLTVPSTAKAVPLENGATILAHGEATGHAHKYIGGATLFRDDGASSGGYVVVDDPVSIVHDEHYPTPPHVGVAIVIRQREYVAGDISRNVED